MRKIARPPLEIFTLSFLDIISCAFAAVVMLVLLSKNGDNGQSTPDISISALLVALSDARAQQQALALDVDSLTKQLANDKSAMEQQQNTVTTLSGAVDNNTALLNQLKAESDALSQQINQHKAMLSAQTKPLLNANEAVGGIPTDAEYVVFVIDNSGSMSSGGKWQGVVSVVSDILKNHPKMKGFQIMAADGEHLYAGKEGKWLIDTPSFRQKVISRLTNFSGGASAPEVGIKKALRLYKNEPGKTSIYVFGDDYRPGMLDDVVLDITKLNQDTQGKPKMRIHGVGFYRPSDGNAERFAAFMQAVAKRNRGAFIGLDF